MLKIDNFNDTRCQDDAGMLVRMMTRMTEKKHGLADTCKDDLHQDDTRMMTASNFNCTHSQDDAGMIRRMMTRMTEKTCGLEKKWGLSKTLTSYSLG